MQLEIIAHADAGAANAPRFASVPSEHAIRGFFGVTLYEHSAEKTAAILNVMGFHKIAEDGNRLRFAAAGTAFGQYIDLLIDPNGGYGRSGAGSVHHIAFRAKDDEAQREWRVEIAKYLDVTPVLDRTYFHSIYSENRAACYLSWQRTRQDLPSTSLSNHWVKNSVSPNGSSRSEFSSRSG